MTETGIVETSPAKVSAGADRLAPGILAARMAVLADRDPALCAGSLPVWDRTLRRRGRTWLWRLTIVVAWSVTLALAGVATLRIGYHDAKIPLIWLNAFTLYLYLPAYVILAWATWRQRWLLAAVSGAVVLCHVAWVAPDFRIATPYQPASGSTAPSRPVRIFFANVLSSNQDYSGILGEITRADPDVVVLVEVQRRWFDQLVTSRVMEPFVHGTSLRGRFPGEVMTFSKLPVRRLQRTWVAGRICNIADVAVGDESLRIYSLHSPRPITELSEQYAAYWKRVVPMVTGEAMPVVVVGDLNATQHSRVYRQLTSRGLRSAHVDRGQGYATTWPNGRYLLPPIRIDQALVSDDVECLAIAEGVGSGSDHKPLILEVRVHAGPNRRATTVAGR